jgi:hypothetical protein
MMLDGGAIGFGLALVEGMDENGETDDTGWHSLSQSPPFQIETNKVACSQDHNGSASRHATRISLWETSPLHMFEYHATSRVARGSLTPTPSQNRT